MDGKGQKAAAAAAGMSERSARTWQEGALPSATRSARTGVRSRTRTRRSGTPRWSRCSRPTDKRVLQATTLIELLQERHPGELSDGQARTLQRRLRDWRADNGPTKEVYFEQRHVAGREAAVDFTHATELGVTIRGGLLEHLLFEFVLSFSGWTWVCLAFGETFEALVSGIQGALAALGGAPQVLRSDNLSAATHELRRTGGGRWCLGSRPCSTTTGCPRRGSSRASHTKMASWSSATAGPSALLARGARHPRHDGLRTSRQYTAFVVDIIDRRNRKLDRRDGLERAALRPLPVAPVPKLHRLGPRQALEHDSRRWPHLLGAVAADRAHVETRSHPDVVEVDLSRPDSSRRCRVCAARTRASTTGT